MPKRLPWFARHFSALVALFAFMANTPATAQHLPAGVDRITSVEGIDEYRLANGLQILLVPDDSKPTTTVNMTYRVGSRQENYGETGMAHLLEHMLFKGTPTHPNVWAEFDKRGLSANGSTWFDRTNYTASFAASDDDLQWYLGWLADAMVNSFIARRDLDTEMPVVRNEMEAGENNPDRMLLQQTMAAMYSWHNYGKNTIGARADVENVDIPRLQAFYKLYYQPDNATLVVSGKFDPPRVLAWVSQSFGAIPKPTRKLPVQYTLDPAQDGERSVTLRRSGGTALLVAGYHVPAGSSPDFAAVEALSLILGDEPSGRLHKRLTEAQLAASIFASPFSLAEPGVLLLGAQLAPGQDVDKAKAELLATIESVADQPITAEELSRAKAKWLKAWDQAFTNPENVGIALSESVALGDWRFFFLTRDHVRGLALADVQRVATDYLVASNRTLGAYLPTEKPLRAPAPARVDLVAALSDFKPQPAAASVEAFDATPANLDARTKSFTIGTVKAALLPKGTRGNAVRAVLTLHFGDEKSLFGQAAVSDAVAASLDKGTTTLTRQQIQDRLDALNTELSISSSASSVTITLASRRDQLPEAMLLVGDMLRHPVFPAAALEEIKRQALAGIEQQRKDPEAMAETALSRLGDPYPRGDVRHAPSFDEMAEDVLQLTPEALRAFHTRFYGASNAEFAAVGDMDVIAVRAALRLAVGGWSSSVPFTRVPQPLVPVKPDRLELATPDKQNAVMLVRLSVPLANNDPDYPALTAANYLLGGGGTSRLWKRIREQEGLSYGVGSGISWNPVDRNSEWQASVIFAPQNREKVEIAFHEEVARALQDGFSDKELEDAKQGLLSLRRLGRAQDASVANALASNLYLGRTFAVSAAVDQALGKLTVEEVNSALRKYIVPESFASAYAGDFKR